MLSCMTIKEILKIRFESSLFFITISKKSRNSIVKAQINSNLVSLKRIIYEIFTQSTTDTTIIIGANPFCGRTKTEKK